MYHTIEFAVPFWMDVEISAKHRLEPRAGSQGQAPESACADLCGGIGGRPDGGVRICSLKMAPSRVTLPGGCFRLGIEPNVVERSEKLAQKEDVMGLQLSREIALRIGLAAGPAWRLRWGPWSTAW